MVDTQTTNITRFKWQLKVASGTTSKNAIDGCRIDLSHFPRHHSGWLSAVNNEHDIAKREARLRRGSRKKVEAKSFPRFRGTAHHQGGDETHQERLELAAAHVGTLAVVCF
jgi:hypothetical protein